VLNPWQWCDADDDTVADFLATTVASVIAAGGWLNPAARFVSRAGDVQVHCDAPEAEPLMALPKAAFLRLRQLSWAPSAGRLQLTGWTEAAGDPELLFAQIGFHNSCDKIPRIASEHPVLAPELDSQSIDAVRAFRPSFRRHQPDPVSLFWSDRALRIAAFESEPEPLALPLIDLLNHHPSGAVGTWTGEAFMIDISRPTSSTECFMNYGLQRDAIGMAVVYGFADMASPLAHSAPVSVNTDGVPITVLARGRSRDGTLLTPVASMADGAWEVSHLSFSARNPVSDLAAATGQSDRWCRRVTTEIARANIAAVDALLESAERHPTSTAHRTLADAGLRQRELLSPYVD